MSADGTAQGMCSAWGCPLLGTVSDGGKWSCCCHFNVGGAANDAITSELHRQKPLVDRALSLRATYAGYAAVLAAESELIEITREIGRQYSIPTAGVVGPTHAEPSFAETDA